MNSATTSAEALRNQIAVTESELKRLKEQLASLEAQDAAAQKGIVGLNLNAGLVIEDDNPSERKWPLCEEEYRRYGRQMIVPSIGIQGQLRLKNASVLIVGAGGLGCPAAAYLAGAGVGTIGIIDGDEVETSNLHRQILHSTAKVGMKKVESAILYLKSLNPNPTYISHPTHLTPQNSISIAAPYDLILDCTDHPTSRYLISDICVLLRKPLVSASALRTDGQLIVLNSPPLPAGNAAGGPCYRCVFPKPPPVESVVSCGDGGILGPVVGVMGVLQALEALKLIVGGKLKSQPTVTPTLNSGPESSPDTKENDGTKATSTPVQTTMLLFSSNSSPPFRNVRLRARRLNCFACSSSASLTLESLTSGSLDYVLFCGVNAPISILTPEERISAKEYSNVHAAQQSQKTGSETHLLIDVREKVQFDICSLPNSINIPFSTFQNPNNPIQFPRQLPQSPASSQENQIASPTSEKQILETLFNDPATPIYVMCRLGNDSQLVTRKLKDSEFGKGGRIILDVKGGLKAWKQDVDSSWPEY
ncbi:related to molybdenum cofactor biosynthetic protein [Rhynchosporium secalis]|uniref:Adenylyltransferase and sulfurtransferase uba4 n=1 Tax=Rhynchosporium secalis TaxID=38038 RepID=A0A1E1ML99_RHYSE|nr:related to molybdenum cofactor biosynthetic protein [Rhynchosporium secalis]